jgi:hypothetical protein
MPHEQRHNYHHADAAPIKVRNLLKAVASTPPAWLLSSTPDQVVAPACILINRLTFHRCSSGLTPPGWRATALVETWSASTAGWECE